MEHILLNFAITYKKRKLLEAPKDFYYNRILGAWISKVDEQLLVNHLNFPSVGTKKEDRETGEDQKGQ
jgi:hypothetical protein